MLGQFDRVIEIFPPARPAGSFLQELR